MFSVYTLGVVAFFSLLFFFFLKYTIDSFSICLYFYPQLYHKSLACLCIKCMVFIVCVLSVVWWVRVCNVSVVCVLSVVQWVIMCLCFECCV